MLVFQKVYFLKKLLLRKSNIEIYIKQGKLIISYQLSSQLSNKNKLSYCTLFDVSTYHIERKEIRMSTKTHDKILLIVPAYNEEENISTVYHTIKNNSNVDVIVINDGSTDLTPYILDKERIPHIDSVCNLGIGGAIQTGYKYASENAYDIAIQFDGDGQHNILDLPKLIEPIINGEVDFCVGSRFIEKNGFQSTFSRRIGIKIISSIIKIVTGKRISDPTSGFRAANKKIIELFAFSYPEEYPEPETLVTLIRKKYRIKEVPVIMNERLGGQSSIHSWKNAYYMINVCLSIILSSLIRKGD